MNHRRSIAGLSLLAFCVSACDSASDPAPAPTSARLSLAPQHTPKNAEPAMANPKAIIISWIGPSDRPTPPTVLWSDKAARDSAAAWLAKKGSAPIGVTDVETTADALACAAKLPEQSTGPGLLVEVTAWDGAAPSTSIRLNADAAKSFLSASITCVGATSPAAGYLKSLLTMVTNAPK